MLYPDYDDEEFNNKITLKKEFNEHKYTTNISKNVEELEEYSNKLCNSEFELAPHQMFIRNLIYWESFIITPKVSTFYFVSVPVSNIKSIQ